MDFIDKLEIFVGLIVQAWLIGKFISLTLEKYESQLKTTHEHATNALRRADDAKGMAVEAHMVANRAEAKVDALTRNGQ